MKATADCFECLQRLISQAVDLATDDPLLRDEARQRAMEILAREFSPSQLSIAIATKVHKAIREITQNPDPYKALKRREMDIARQTYLDLLSRMEAKAQKQAENRRSFYERDIRTFLKLAAAGNAIDFFRKPEEIRREIEETIDFVVDHSPQFKRKLRSTSKVLFLADNAGEIYFDLLLVKWIEQYAQVTYVVKPSPVQDDTTLEDIKKAGLEGEFGRIIDTGVASPGVVFSLASAQFKEEFDSADLILAKGMGHYEALSELPAQGRFFYCLKAKCLPVAKSLGVPLNSYVAILQ